MDKLNCSVGDLAITIQSHNPENLGTIVSITSAEGLISWDEREPEFTWNCEIATNGWLVYELNGYPITQKKGLIPDRCLKPITPPKNYLIEEISAIEIFGSDFYAKDPT